MSKQVTARIVKGSSYQLSSQAQLSSLEAAFGREGYVISSWNTRPDGSGDRLDPVTTVQSATSAYAQWKKCGLVMTATSGKRYYFDASNPQILSSLRYTSGTTGVEVSPPFNQYADLSGKNGLSAVKDETGEITAVLYNGFANCKGLFSASLPSVSSLGERAFWGCSGLTYVEMPAVSRVPRYAFSGCSSLVSAAFPAAVSVGEYSFDCCAGLMSVNLSAAETIDINAFGDCHRLSSIYVDSATMRSVGNGYEDGAWLIVDRGGTSALNSAPAIARVKNDAAAYISAQVFYDRQSLSSARFVSAKYVGAAAFGYCKKLADIGLPAAQTLDSGAFIVCDKLSFASFPSVRTISSAVFRQCGSLSAVDIPVVESIGSNAFRECYGLKRVSMLSVQAPPAIDATSFGAPYKYDSKISVYVPDGMHDDFVNAPVWKDINTETAAEESAVVQIVDPAYSPYRGLLTRAGGLLATRDGLVIERR